MVGDLKKAAILIILLFLIPFARACFFPQDLYAVEVELKDYNLNPLLKARNIVIEDHKIIYRSHYDPRLIVMIWNDSKLHVRVQIPTKSVEEKIFTEEFTGVIPAQTIVERAKESGWDVKEYYLKKDNITIYLTPKVGKECKSDSDCKTGGCSGELCLKKNETAFSTCIYREWYECLKLTKCGCYNGFCTWKPNPLFMECLKKYNVSIEKIIKAKTQIRIEIKGEINDKIIREIEYLLECKIPRNFNEIDKTSIVPTIDPRIVNAGTAIESELRWLREVGVIKIKDEDIKKISEIAKWGYSGYNAHIGFYDGEWKPYFNASNAELIRCVGNGFKDYQEELPKDPPTIERGTCGPAVMILLTLIGILGGKRRENSNDVLGRGNLTRNKGKSSEDIKL
ncbi:TPA: eight-cysteine-cluster domain-containing protein [Pyrococcus horikoshii]|uniref:Eight-cysteine-cluster domain-containing protein n=2 Tax=Pyrococcus horikoshii TaxID=53953 RepID=O58448_PYRHO|nr:395aa long hypothetical protein [Pyrococcus horikoshii OT3]HII61373.1 eight-cysteine-cluster domain-containing protein [Pyrococcus horikoshii]